MLHSKARDLRIDFFRGLCLVVIFTLHINPNFLKKFSFTALGFSDGAELFVFLSGYVCGGVYQKVLVSGGFLACQGKALRRLFQIYVAHLGTLIACLALFGFVFAAVPSEKLWLQRFVADPGTAIQQAVTLSYLPWCFDILPLYLVLLPWLPIMLWLGQKAGAGTMVLASFLLYAAVQVFPDYVRPPGAWAPAWYFNPFAWQLLFVLGAAWRTWPSDRSFLPRGKGVVFAAAGGLALLALAKFGYAYVRQPQLFSDFFDIVFGGAALELPQLRFPFPGTGKRNFEPLRLIHFALLVVLATRLLPRQAALWQSRLAQPLIHCGQNSLMVFCFGNLCVYTAMGSLHVWGPSLANQAAVNVLGWCALLLFGCGLHSAYQLVARLKTRLPAGRTHHRQSAIVAAVP